MTNDEYRKAEGLNYSLLSTFNKSPDHTFIPFNGNTATMLGHCYEDLLFEKSGLLNDFSARYVVAPEINKRTKEGKEKWAKFEEDNKGKTLLKSEEYDMLQIMTDNMLKLQFLGHEIAELLKYSAIEVPLFWETNGIKKKAKLDLLFEIGDTLYPADLKTFGKELSAFQWAIRDGYFIQDCHYVEGIRAEFPDKNVEPMTFLVSSKQKPYLAQAWRIEDGTRDRCDQVYDELVQKFVNWESEGKPQIGFIPEVGQAKFYL